MSEPTKGEQARSSILTVAKQLFLSQGYNGTSMRAIAAEAGYKAVAGLYNHFPNKQSIFEALIREHSPYRELLPLLENISASTAPEFIRQALRAALPLVLKYYEFFQLMQIDIREFQGATIAQVIQKEALPLAMSVFQRLDGLSGLTLEPGSEFTTLRLIISLVAGFVLTEQMAPPNIFPNQPPEWWADCFADMILNGIATVHSADTPRS